MSKKLLSEEAWWQLWRDQGGECAICGCGLEDASHTDHCHTTGVVRGLLCPGCNLGLGHFRDSTDNLRSAIEYLVRSRSKTQKAPARQ